MKSFDELTGRARERPKSKSFSKSKTSGTIAVMLTATVPNIDITADCFPDIPVTFYA